MNILNQIKLKTQNKKYMPKYFKLSFVLTILFSITVFAQEREKDTLDTNVNVVRPYTPSVNDAFKVKESPKLEDEENTTKKEVKYNIFSFPVASTFTPAKGKAANVDKTKPVKLYDNYATLGVGTYTTIVGEVYLNHTISRNESVGGYFSHQSSQGGIQDVLTDDNFAITKLNANYSQKLNDMAWKVQGGFETLTYNWYGLPQPLFDETTTNGLDVKHTFHDANIGGDISFENTYVTSGSVLFRRFGDNQGSGENHFTTKIGIDIPVQDEEIATTIHFDYLSGSFDRNFITNDELNYGNIQFGVSPSYQIIKDDLTLNLGASLYYLNDTEANRNKFYVYPNITASYRLVNEVLILFGGIEGELIQNTYHQIASENPFVSPTLFVVPTDQQYNVFGGFKGKLSNAMSYNVSGRYIADRFKALYKNNEISIGSEDYMYGNSYGIVYDDVTTLGFSGELNVAVNRNFTLTLKGDYFSYTTDEEEEAWNLPDFRSSLFLDYQISEHWFAGANVFYVGERKDYFFYPNLASPVAKVVTLDSFFDANAHVGYHINDQFSVFARVNNIANNEYQRWQNYPVQGFQALAGATYKFDF